MCDRAAATDRPVEYSLCGVAEVMMRLVDNPLHAHTLIECLQDLAIER